MKQILLILPGVQDPMVPQDHRGGPYDVGALADRMPEILRTRDWRKAGYKLGPVLTALTSARDQGAKFDEVWLAYSPDSEPADMNVIAQLSRRAIEGLFEAVQVREIRLVKRIEEPGHKEAVEKPMHVADIVEVFSIVPAAITDFLKGEKDAELTMIMGPGTPQMNFALLELARTREDIQIMQTWHPNPGRSEKPLNKQSLRTINRKLLEFRSPLGRQIALLQEENLHLKEELDKARKAFTEREETLNGVGEITLEGFATSGREWTKLSDEEKKALLLEASVREMSWAAVAKHLRITDRALRDARKKFGIE